MSKENTITVRLLPDGTVIQEMPDGSTRSLESDTDWDRFDSLTEEEISAAAMSDPDSVLLTDEQLAESRHIPNPRVIRQKLHMTQEQFAAKFRVPLGTLRDWEQGVRTPNHMAKNYLHVIAKNPQAVLDALEEN